MKKYMIGGFAGYLLTSIFSIPQPPSIFWWFSLLLLTILSYLYLVWWRMDNDNYGDIDE